MVRPATKVSTRFWAELAIAIGLAALALFTLIRPDWIELLFGVDPDEGSGALEWGIVVLFAAIALLAGTFAGREWRRARAAER